MTPDPRNYKIKRELSICPLPTGLAPGTCTNLVDFNEMGALDMGHDASTNVLEGKRSGRFSALSVRESKRG